ncbi:MAG: tyrosine-type recombinase/integrase [Bacillota bacterium]
MTELFLTLAPSTARAYRQDLDDFGRWFEQTNGTRLEPGLVTGTDLREYLHHLLAVRGLKPATANRRLSAIRAWLRWYREQGAVESLPRFPRRASEPQRAPRALGKVEAARLERAVEREGNPRDAALVALMLHAGLRVGEVVRLRPTDVEITERKGKVVVRAGKGDKYREVPLGPEVRRPLKEYLRVRPHGEWLFPGRNGGHLTPRAAETVVKKYAYLARLDPEEVTPHVLRHTFATRLLRGGADIVVVAHLLGHARLDTTARYTRPAWEDLVRAVEPADANP